MGTHEPQAAALAEAGTRVGAPSAHDDATGAQLRTLVPCAAFATDRLGPPEAWSTTLRTAASICLTSRFPILLWWGPDLRLVYNDAYRPMLGIKHPDAFGAPGREVWPEIWDTIEPMLEQVRSGRGATWSTDELLVLDRNGFPEECYFTFSYSPVVDDAGVVEGVFSVISETTDRVLGERRLRTLADMARLAGSESRTDALSRAVAALHDNVGDHPVALVLDVAPHAPRAELARGLAERAPCLSDRTRARLADLVRQVASTGRPLTVAAEADPAAPLVSSWHLYPVPEPSEQRAENGRAVMVLGGSVQRPWDDALDSYAELCATHVAGALTAVTQLLDERRRAAALTALDEAKSEFFMNVSHELRTPLTLMTAPLEDALAHASTPDQRRRLGLVARHTQHLTRLVDELLDLGRIEAGRMEPDPAPVDLAALTRTLAESFRPAVEGAGLQLVVACGDLGAPTLVDPEMYERVVVNLLSNALKYTPRGSVEVQLHVVGGEVELTVRDTGVGIADRDLERVFERFERLPERPGARARAGAGVGLAMVRQLSQLMGGSVRVRSRVGRGSAFTVRLPVDGGGVTATRSGAPSVTRRGAHDVLRDVEAWFGDPAADAEAVPVPEHRCGERAHLLVVEDHPDLRRYLAEVLGEDYDVEVAADGPEAVELMRRSAPDLVVADVMMPGMDGYDLVRGLRADPHLSGIPVLLLSARSGAGATSEGLLAGADDYLTKPFSVVELRARVSSNLERAGARMQDASWRRAMLGSFHEALLLTDLDGVLLEANDEFARLLGCTTASPAGSAAPGAGPGEGLTARALGGACALLEEVVRLAREGGGTASRDVEVATVDGRTVWVSLRVSVVDGGRLRPSFAIATVRDVTSDHEARVRRSAAACISTELSAAEDLTDVVATAVSGFGSLFAGEVTVRVDVGRERRLFTAAGPAAGAPQPLEAGFPDGEPTDEPVAGLRFVDPDGSGAQVTVCFDEPRPVGADERVAGDLLFRAFVLACERVVAASEFADREQHLRLAIESHEAIGQAVGILVERHRWTPGVAFDRLKKASQDQNIKLRVVAEQVVLSGTDPGPESR
ncbi:hypothetical protein GCM10023168_16950 [Fodinibacter luteus]|uniref:histidine kinase n=1 Tax=Fodinibacter luteus TaxID=552064 RepID=A0ABP8KDN0_9MICO